MKRTTLVLVCASMALGFATHVPSASAGAVLPGTPDSRRGAAARPNIILILADDLGYADISVYPGGRFPTPNIERIARDGVLFADGYATAPVCGPSRAGLLTGRYQQRFGFEYNDGPAKRDVRRGLGLATGELTLAQLLQRAGYHTGMIGKWHLGSAPQFYPLRRGFDEFVGFLPGQSSYIDPRLPGVHMSYGPLGDDVIQDLHPRRSVVHNERQYLTDYFGDRAARFIRDHSQADQPYFLYLAFNAPHAPHTVTTSARCWMRLRPRASRTAR